MTRVSTGWLTTLVGLALIGCGPTPSEPDRDAGQVDATSPDVTSPDAASPDADPGNRSPSAIDDAVEVAPSVATEIDVLANDVDPDGDVLVVLAVGEAAHGTVARAGAGVSYRPDADFTGSDELTYVASDGRGGIDSATVRVTVLAGANLPPLAVTDAVETSSGVPVSISVLANDSDPEGGALVVAMLGDPLGGTVTTDGTIVTYVSTGAFTGADAFEYTVRDSVGGIDTATVRVTVVPSLVSGYIAARGNQSLAIRSDGTLVAWGQATHLRATTASPAAVGTATDWRQVEAGGGHTCAIDATGALHCWGDGSDGKLGLGADRTYRMLPTRVGTDVGWSDVALGAYHTCGVRDGVLLCWGENNAGKLGLGDAILRDVPAIVPSATGWTAVAAGDEHSCGIRAGELWCWGHNGLGQAGDPAIGASTSSPTRIGARSDWIDVVAGGGHTCARPGDGSLWCWGRVSPTERFEVPTQIGTSTGWSAVAAGAASTCGIDAGALSCWGANVWGQLGDGTQVAHASPTRVGTGSDWSRVAVGSAHACAMRASGAVSCWGARASGQIGDGVAVGSTLPLRVGARTDWASVMAGGDYACATSADGALSCWGVLRLFGAEVIPGVAPTQLGTMTGWANLPEGGPSHLCAMRSDLGLWCWGTGIYGRLGLGSSTSHALPQPVGGTTMFIDAAAGDAHTCAVVADGSMQCWGLNNARQVGIATGSEYWVPVAVGTDTTYVSVAAGLQHTCAVRANGTMWCWGAGSGSVPTQLGTATDWRTVRAARQRNCAITTSGALWCWTQGGTDLARVGLDADWADVSVASAGHVCGTRTGGSLWCFGSNGQGQLGDGTTSSATLPVRVGTDSDWTAVAAGGSVSAGHTCGVRSDGSLWCWGMGDQGQLGLGNAIAATPVPVPGS